LALLGRSDADRAIGEAHVQAVAVRFRIAATASIPSSLQAQIHAQRDLAADWR